MTVGKNFFNSTFIVCFFFYYFKINSTYFEMYLISGALSLQVESVQKYISFVKKKNEHWLTKRTLIHFSLFKLFKNLMSIGHADLSIHHVSIPWVVRRDVELSCATCELYHQPETTETMTDWITPHIASLILQC